MVHTWSTACLRADPQGPGISKSVPPPRESLSQVSDRCPPALAQTRRNVGAAAVTGQPVSFFE